MRSSRRWRACVRDILRFLIVISDAFSFPRKQITAISSSRSLASRGRKQSACWYRHYRTYRNQLRLESCPPYWSQELTFCPCRISKRSWTGPVRHVRERHTGGFDRGVLAGHCPRAHGLPSGVLVLTLLVAGGFTHSSRSQSIHAAFNGYSTVQFTAFFYLPALLGNLRAVRNLALLAHAQSGRTGGGKNGCPVRHLD